MSSLEYISCKNEQMACSFTVLQNPGGSHVGNGCFDSYLFTFCTIPQCIAHSQQKSFQNPVFLLTQYLGQQHPYKASSFLEAQGFPKSSMLKSFQSRSSLQKFQVQIVSSDDHPFRNIKHNTCRMPWHP